MQIKELIEEYGKRRLEIKGRLSYFKEAGKMNEEKLFAELCFCLCTPQSSAVICDRAIARMVENKVLYEGDYKNILANLIGVRFNHGKALNIIKARELKLCDALKKENLRDWLVENVRGLGYKEASHFMRNIGLSENIAILDRHILKNLVNYGVIDEVPKSLTKKRYFEIEEKMREFSRKINIPMDELDLLFWAKQTGFIFK